MLNRKITECHTTELLCEGFINSIGLFDGYINDIIGGRNVAKNFVLTPFIFPFMFLHVFVLLPIFGVFIGVFYIFESIARHIFYLIHISKSSNVWNNKLKWSLIRKTSMKLFWIFTAILMYGGGLITIILYLCGVF